MTTGEKLKAARLEAGLSQRRLCGDVITRNMLSQIENGSANPSMATLQYLAGRLGKSVGYFLQEQALESPNPALMQQARDAYAQRRYQDTVTLLTAYRAPDPIFDQEQRYLLALASLAQAEQLLRRQETAAAVLLLEQMPRDSLYYRKEMEQTRRQLLQQAYPILEEACRLRKDFEQAYAYACKLRDLQRKTEISFSV